MAIPRRYRGLGEGALASYDGYDFNAGIGRKNFYGMMNASGALVTDNLYSDKIDTVTSSISGTGHIQTIVFTNTFQMPAILANASAFVDVPLGVAAGNAGTVTAFASCAIIHVSGSTTTELGKSTTGSLSSTNPTNNAFIKAAEIPISKTKLKKEDKIILQLDVWVTASTGADKVAVAHDPAGRTPTQANSDGAMDWSTGALSTLILNLPFVIDL